MDKAEILRELKMTYSEMQNYLLKKYGPAVVDYFHTAECKYQNRKVSRTSEGLYCHHMDEDKGGNLSTPSIACSQPFEWQKKERLVYCNILEHLILHMKIDVLRQNRVLQKPHDIESFFTTHGVLMVCKDINDMFVNAGTSVAWKKRCFEEIKDNYSEYIQLVRAFMLYIERAYKGEKSNDFFLKPGSLVYFLNGDCEILKLTAKKDKILLKMPNGEEKGYRSSITIDKWTYADYMDIEYREMAAGFDKFYEDIYQDFLNCPITDVVKDYAAALLVDYSTDEFLWGSRAYK